jgi:hypothetical protein
MGQAQMDAVFQIKRARQKRSGRNNDLAAAVCGTGVNGRLYRPCIEFRSVTDRAERRDIVSAGRLRGNRAGTEQGKDNKDSASMRVYHDDDIPPDWQYNKH